MLAKASGLVVDENENCKNGEKAASRATVLPIRRAKLRARAASVDKTSQIPT